SKCGKPARVGFCSLDDGRRVRVCRSCGEVID
ncbi:MAG: 50S ribosomal protein L24, partial [Dehalococcoidia bacterium]|nr:50S ribosomal protein L24 [Dehalococcoidia bacterium]